MKKFLIFVLIAGILGGGGYGAYYYYTQHKAGTAERVSSTADNAVYVDLVSTITGYGSGTGLIERFGGEVCPQATLEVKLENDRTVEECFVKEGDEVRTGQRLFVYDTREDEDKLAQAEIDIEKSKSDIELAERSISQLEHDKNTADADDQLMITTSILTAQNEIKQHEYDIKTKELEMEKLRESIANAAVTSEMDGIVQKISDPNSSGNDYYYGNSGGDSAYITILSVGDFRIKGKANEQNMQLLTPGMPMIVHSRVDDAVIWRGTVTEIDTDNTEEENSNVYVYGAENESGSSNYVFYVELENSEGLMLGQHVYLEEDAGQTEEKTGMWLEEYYILEEDGKSYVWRANSSNKIEKHEITLGDYDEELMEYEVLDGLAADDYIAFPMDTITEGDPVIYNDFSDTDGMSSPEDYDPDMDPGMDQENMDPGMAPENMNLDEPGMAPEDMNLDDPGMDQGNMDPGMDLEGMDLSDSGMDMENMDFDGSAMEAVAPDAEG